MGTARGRQRLAAALAATTLTAAACHPPSPRFDYAAEPDPRTREYVLGIGDALAIFVWQQPGLGSEAVIRPDGTITMPLIGDLRAAGMTPSQLKGEIEARLAAFVKLDGSEIAVQVRAANSYRFTVSGEVTRPGVFTEARYVTVAEAIALAGGLTRFAARNRMRLLRRDPASGELRRIPLAYDLLVSGERPEMNLVLLAGDALFVP